MGAASNSQQTRRAIADADRAVAAEGQSIADIIGATVALHLADLLARLPLQPECATCVRDAKTAIRAYEVLCKIRERTGDVAPSLPDPPLVAQAVTWQDGSPVCFGHFQVSDGQPVSAP